MFVVFEGIDRCGKTTQSKLLFEKLKFQGQKVEWIRFPDRNTPIGKMLDQYLGSASDLIPQVSHLLFSANRWELQFKIKNLLEDGFTIICDRYWYSGLAYSVACGLNFDWCISTDTGLIAPDKVIYLKMMPEDAAQRGDYGLERYEKQDVQEKVYQAYSLLHQENWISFDANRDVEIVHDEIMKSLSL